MAEWSDRPERSQQPEEPERRRIGVYVCHCGGNISDVVDVEAVADQAAQDEDVVVARHLMFMCSDEGQSTIERDIEDLGLDRVVVAACTPSLHETTFRRTVARAGLNPYLYQHANIREQVSWAHVHDHAAATEKAARLIRAAIAKAASLRELDEVRVDAVHRALVVGGGVAGLRAALDLARWGMEVVLVERSGGLGGNVLRLGRTYPSEEPGRALVEGLVAAVRSEPSIDVRLWCEVKDVSGYVGDFRVGVHSVDPSGNGHPCEGEVEVGAIVLATGFRDYEPSEGEYGFGHPRVVTLPAYQQRVYAESTDGDLAAALGIPGPVRSVAFLHCVGSRQVEGIDGTDGKPLNTYCSRVCCTASVRAAAETRRRFPEVRVVDVFRDIRTYARDQEEAYREAGEAGVLFVRLPDGERARVETSGNGDGWPLLVRARDSLTFGEELELPVDVVVLATGMEPGGAEGLVEATKAPTGADGFLLEVHPKLRPVESAIPGILLAGTARGPMDITESTTSASAAAAKVATLLARDQVEMEPFVARVDVGRCTGNGACVAACPYSGALGLQEVELEDGVVVTRAYVNPVACKGCGACVAVCPSGAIDVQGWEIGQYVAMVEAITAEEPEVAVGEKAGAR
ncbi:MAG TPA: CoB--CoM heterodisulfide reductase iron-sulfur subunit A family protein [Actinomycetota bacterium]|jgi:heterodisulfide reductase subunit A|nr:CoB--CoM heterodisulfide reductase iron-sulfur subunit A family protein [Actinomycetota bacterium]